MFQEKLCAFETNWELDRTDSVAAMPSFVLPTFYKVRLFQLVWKQSFTLFLLNNVNRMLTYFTDLISGKRFYYIFLRQLLFIMIHVFLSVYKMLDVSWFYSASAIQSGSCTMLTVVFFLQILRTSTAIILLNELEDGFSE